MYQDSSKPIFPDRDAKLARDAAASDARILDMRRTSAEGRIRLWNTLVKPSSLVDPLGMGTALDAQRLQNQTATARASGLIDLSQSDSTQPTIADMIAGAPECVSLNRTGAQCDTYSPPLQPFDYTPGMPQRAPDMVNTSRGPMYYRGAAETFGPGLAGSPPWADANSGEGGLGQWIMDHPLMAIGIAGVGLFAFSRRGK